MRSQPPCGVRSRKRTRQRPVALCSPSSSRLGSAATDRSTAPRGGANSSTRCGGRRQQETGASSASVSCRACTPTTRGPSLLGYAPGLPPGQASIIRSHQRRWPDEIAGHLPVVFPLSPFRGRPSCNLSPPSFGRGGLSLLLRRLVDGEARSIGEGGGPERSFVRVGDLGPKDKLGLLRRVFGAAHDSVDPGERERVDLLDQGGALDRVRFKFLHLDRPLCCCSQPAA